MKSREYFIGNSSSSNFVVISSSGKWEQRRALEGKELIIDESTGCHEFGWQNTTYTQMGDKISFAAIQTYSVANPTTGRHWRDMIQRVIKEYTGATKVSFNYHIKEYKMKNSYLSDAYIDHQSNAGEGKNIEIFDSDDKLKTFLFNKSSYIQGGNDND